MSPRPLLVMQMSAEPAYLRFPLAYQNRLLMVIRASEQLFQSPGAVLGALGRTPFPRQWKVIALQSLAKSPVLIGPQPWILLHWLLQNTNRL